MKRSRSDAMIETQHPAEAMNTFKRAESRVATIWLDQTVVEPLVISLFVIQPHNTRPTELNFAKSSIPGTHYLAARF